MLTSPDTSKAKLAKITTIAVTTPSEIKAKPARITSIAEPTPPKTPKKPISWAEIASRPIVSPKPSRLTIPSPKSIPRALENAPLTPSSTPSQKPAQMRPKHQNPHIQKPCLTLNDLHRMFAGKPKPIGLQKGTVKGIREAYWARTYFDKGNTRGGRIQPIRGRVGRIQERGKTPRVG